MEKLNKTLPDKPGVYFFKKGNKVLYIGKATSLKNRVKSYFTDDLILKRSAHIRNMVLEATSVDYKTTTSSLEALLLESQLIKKYQPYYNTREKDDKSYNFVVITKEDFPRIFTVRGKELKDWKSEVKKVYGPFPHGGELKEALRIIRKIFPYKDKKSSIKTTSRFNQSIGLEPSSKNKKEYQNTIRNISLLFQGKKSDILKNLKKQMEDFAQEKEFEKAAIVRDQIFALNHINDIALLKREVSDKYDPLRRFRIEAYDIAHTGGKDTYGVMSIVVNGQTETSEYRAFKIKGKGKDRIDDAENLDEIIRRRFAHPEWEMPDLVVIDGGLAQRNRALKVLNSIGLKVPVVSVVKDEKHKPKDIIGDSKVVKDYRHDVLLANSESHRFAIKHHRKARGKMIK